MIYVDWICKRWSEGFCFIFFIYQKSCIHHARPWHLCLKKLNSILAFLKVAVIQNPCSVRKQERRHFKASSSHPFKKKTLLIPPWGNVKALVQQSRIEPTTIGLEGRGTNHWATVPSQIGDLWWQNNFIPFKDQFSDPNLLKKKCFQFEWRKISLSYHYHYYTFVMLHAAFDLQAYLK